MKSTSVSNPDSSLYDGVYESTNNGQSSYDYIEVSNLDADITSSSSNLKATTKDKQNSGTALSSYTEVNFTNIGGGQHRIMVAYRKDGSENKNDDKGYVLIPKSQE